MATHRTVTLSDRVAAEIRGWLGKRNMSAAALARRLEQSRSWVSLRITGQQEIGLNDLERIAYELDVTIGQLLGIEGFELPEPLHDAKRLLEDEGMPEELKGLFLRVLRRVVQEIEETPRAPQRRKKSDARR
jgi:transcriptional regulator with XRE-family HTH domain